MVDHGLALRPALEALVRAVPRLDGELRVDDDARSSAAVDFGLLVRRVPGAVLRPRSGADVAAVVGLARRFGVPVAVRGQGHSVFGQALTADGLVIDMRTLCEVREVGDRHARVDAGCTWRQVLDAALEGDRPKAPPVMNGFSLLSVGGTLSVGGLSGMACRRGCQVEHVRELEVVTGEGRVVVCSESRNRRLFEAVLAGQGQCGVIVSADLVLEPVKPRTREFTIVFPSLDALVAAMNALLEAMALGEGPKLDLVWGGAARAPHGFVFSLFANAHHDPTTDAEPDERELFRAIDLPMRPIATDRSYRDYIAEMDRRVLAIPSGPGRYPLWLDLFLPEEELASFAAEVIHRSGPDDLGAAGLVLFFPLETRTNTRPLLRLPASRRAYLLDYFRNTDEISSAQAAELVARNDVLYRRARDRGATLYPIGAVPMTTSDWREHYGPVWDRFVEDKRRFDPSGILGNGVGIFGGHDAADARPA